MKVAEWIRVSDESQAAPERFGIPAQRSVNRETCKRHGLEVVKTFQVEDVSGKDILRAPETRELVDLMRSGRIHGVVSREFSRLMRPDDFADYVLLSEFQRSKILLYLPDGIIDFNDKMGRLMAGMQASISGYERSMIRERLHRGSEENRKSGGRCAPYLPKGVGHSKERGWFYTEESSKVKRAFEMVLAGETIRSIAHYLGVSPGGARHILHNPVYMGWRVYDSECGDPRPSKDGRQPKYRPKRKRAEEQIIRVKVIDEPLVSPETWARACKLLDIATESRRSTRKGGFASYNGFLFCDECGRILTPVRGSGKGYYVCLGHQEHSGCPQGYVRIAEMETRIDSLIGSQMKDRAFLRHLAARFQAARKDDPREARMSQLELERKSLDRKRNRVIEMYSDGDIVKEEKDERLAKIAERLDRVNTEASRLEETASPRMTAEQLASMFTIFVGWESRTKEDRRKLLSLYVPRMRVRDGEIVSVYRLLDDREVRIDRNSLIIESFSSRYCRAETGLPAQ